MTVGSDNPFPSVLMVEGDPEALDENPAAGQRRLAVGTDHLLYLVDDAGVATEVGGGAAGAVATDAIWDAAGDLVQGTGANTGAKLSAGTAGNFLKSAGAAAANLWAFPPGHELDYVAFTAPVAISGTNEAGGQTVVTGTSQAYAAEPILIHFYSPRVVAGAGIGAGIVVFIEEDGTTLGNVGFHRTGASGASNADAMSGFIRRTPSAATHQYVAKAYRTTANGSVEAGTGGTGADVAGFIRITKV